MTAIAWLDLAIDIIWTAVVGAALLLATFGLRELRFNDRAAAKPNGPAPKPENWDG